MRPITYSLQFRGQVDELPDGYRKQGRAPGCALVTSLSVSGLDARYVWAPDDEEAFFESTLLFVEDGGFQEDGRIRLPRGHVLHLRGAGQLVGSPDPHLRHGTASWQVTGGAGQFGGASGRVTSNFLVSDTGELTENQLGVIFAPQGARTRDLPGANESPSARPSTQCPGQPGSTGEGGTR